MRAKRKITKNPRNGGEWRAWGVEGKRERGGNTFPLAQFNPGAAREDGASEIERINAEERRFRSGTTDDI